MLKQRGYSYFSPLNKCILFKTIMAFRTSLLPGLRNDAASWEETEAPGAVISLHASASPAAPARCPAMNGLVERHGSLQIAGAVLSPRTRLVRYQGLRRLAICQSCNLIRAGEVHT